MKPIRCVCVIALVVIFGCSNTQEHDLELVGQFYKAYKDTQIKSPSDQPLRPGDVYSAMRPEQRDELIAQFDLVSLHPEPTPSRRSRKKILCEFVRKDSNVTITLFTDGDMSLSRQMPTAGTPAG